jgi:hypothetical protein
MEDRIPIEEWVRNISKFPRVFTIALFDCCRIPVTGKGEEEKSKTGKTS